ncbi:hypothetical protein [Prosthecobacter sp.]|uniref:hypothetical protein n=1 Tax=Prosthecobacter sp. TaxID=1965333 RepID=UPI00248A7636|nr:hypothetical protein [Prosthecobacter sp.]MDI1314408.1 hypothetical protein [Prosthecobacter sp.]
MKTALPCPASLLWLFMALVLTGHVHADNALEIIGRWECVESRIGTTTFTTAQGEKNPVAEFRADGTFTEGNRSGTYRCFDDTVLRLTFLENGKKGVSKDYQIRITGDSMVKKSSDRSKLAPEEKYRRLK